MSKGLQRVAEMFTDIIKVELALSQICLHDGGAVLNQETSEDHAYTIKNNFLTGVPDYTSKESRYLSKE